MNRLLAVPSIAVPSRTRIASSTSRRWRGTGQDIGQQRGGLDVAAVPADVVERDRADAACRRGLIAGWIGHREGEHVRHDSGRMTWLRTGIGAARDLQVDRLVLSRQLLPRQALEHRPPLLMAERVLHPDGGKAAVEALEVMGDPERQAAIGRHHLVYAVAEQQPAIRNRQACPIPAGIHR